MLTIKAAERHGQQRRFQSQKKQSHSRIQVIVNLLNSSKKEISVIVSTDIP